VVLVWPTQNQAIHQFLIHFVPALVTKADQVERRGRCQFESRIVLHPNCELLRQFNVTPNVILQAFDAVVTDHEPEFQGAKSAAERNLPVAIIDHCSRFCGLVA
jgi:hypothetical protein